MNLRLIAVWVMVAGLSFLSPAVAQPMERTQVEIDFLLQYVEVSGCEFYRNGTWHDSGRAREHLTSKYEYLAARDRIRTAEDFIDQAASKSSLSGRAYEVRCGACPTVTTSEWLSGVLARYRKSMARENESS
jgi:Family of unknown function (DUF5329)